MPTFYMSNCNVEFMQQVNETQWDVYHANGQTYRLDAHMVLDNGAITYQFLKSDIDMLKSLPVPDFKPTAKHIYQLPRINI